MMAEKVKVTARVNGENREFLCEPRQSLLECLRDVLGLTGTKEGCNDGNCGACSVLLDGRLVNSCLVLGVEIEGREVTTIEGLSDGGRLHPIQQAFIDEDALQCGYCTPGFILATKALLDREPNPSESRIRNWLAGNLCRCTGYDRIVRAVRTASRQLGKAGPTREHSAAHTDAKQTDALAFREAFKVIGTQPRRYEAADKVLGRSTFGADVRLPGTLYAKVLRSPHAHARIRSIDTSRADALDGVYATVTGKNLPAVADYTAQLGEGTVNFKHLRDNNLAGDKVLYMGHAVAGVAATSAHVAELALASIEVDYEVLPAVVDVLDAMKETAPLLHEELVTQSLGTKDSGGTARNVALHFQHAIGDPQKGFARADVVVEREFRTATVHQGYIEPQSATAVWGPEGFLTVYSTTQGGFALREQLAQLLIQPLSKIRVVPAEVGGGFGGKITSFIETTAALLSRKTGRPVKISLDRSEVFTSTGPTSGTLIRVKMGAKKSGEITSASAELFYEAGAFPGSSVSSGANAIFACYDIPNARVDGYDVVVNKPKTSAYRAPGVTPVNFAVEQLIDELAERIEMDPLDFRLRNTAKEGTRRVDGRLHTEIGSVEVLEAAKRHAHYAAPIDGPHRGRGVAHAYWGNWGAQSSCTISVNPDGTVNLVTGSVDLTGTRTSLAMQAAETLGLELRHVRPSVADTDSVGFTNVTAGSRTTVATGQAVVNAAREVITRMRRRAAVLWQISTDRVTYKGGVFAAGQENGTKDGKRLSFAELASQLTQTGGPVSVVGTAQLDEWGSAFGTHIVDVEVDPETGKVTILRYTVVQDAGRAIHPGQVEGQMQGGATQGIGWALYEGYAYDKEGRMLNPTLLDYRLPTTLDVPPIETVIVEVPYPKHPFGARGVGEIPIVPPPAAIANAIYRATGARVENLPMSPARILEATGIIQ